MFSFPLNVYASCVVNPDLTERFGSLGISVISNMMMMRGDEAVRKL